MNPVVSIRGNKKICALEDRLAQVMPEPLSRSRLFNRAIYAAHSTTVDWRWTYGTLQSLDLESSTEIPALLQARLDSDSEEWLNKIREDIRQALNLDRATNVLCWQLLLTNLLQQENEIKRETTETIRKHQEIRPVSQSDGIALINRLLELLMIGHPSKTDEEALAKIVAVLDQWDLQHKSC